MQNEIGDEGLIQDYIRDVAIGTDPDSVENAIRDAYDKLSRRGGTPPFRVIETWAYGSNPFTEFRVVIKGGG
jgi:hypothetical protein